VVVIPKLLTTPPRGLLYEQDIFYGLQNVGIGRYRAVLIQLTTAGLGYSGDVTRQDDTPSLTMFNIVVWQDGMTPHC
jgi:hypothetical protein